MHAIAHGGYTDTVRESALKIYSGRKISCCTGESNLRRQRAGPMLYQLSYMKKKKKKEEKEKRMWVAICPIDPSFGSCLPAKSLSRFGLISIPSSPRRTLIFKNSPRNRISKEVDCVLLDIQGLIMYIP